MKDLGQANVVLNIKIIREFNKIIMSQSHYIEQLLKKFGYFNCKLVSIPYDFCVYLKKNLSEPLKRNRYAQLLGSLGYLVNFTRSDLAYTVNRLSRYTYNLNRDH